MRFLLALALLLVCSAAHAQRGGPCDVRGCTMTGAVKFGASGNQLTVTGGATSASPIVFQSTAGNTGGIQINGGTPGVQIGSAGTGIVTLGQIILGNNATYTSSGSTLARSTTGVFTGNGSYAGSADLPSFNTFTVTNGVAATNIQGISALKGSITSASTTTGDQIGIHSDLNIVNLVTGGNQQHVSGLFTGQMTVNQGGSAPTAGNSAGSLFGINPNVILRSGATDISGLIGQENDCAVASGATAQQVTCLQIIHTSSHAVQGNDQDIAFGIFDQEASTIPGWKEGVSIGGRDQQWPIDQTSGVVAVARPESSSRVGARDAGQLKTASAFSGLDLSLMNVTDASGFSFRGSGSALGSAGTAYFANAKISTNASGVQLDIPNQIVTGGSVTTPGGGVVAAVYPGDVLYGLTSGPYPGQYKVTHVQAVSGSTIAAAGSGGTNGAQVVTLSGGTCTTAPQFNVTVTGGAISAVNSVATAGDCTVVPGAQQTNRAWAVTGASLAGASLNVALGAKTLSILVPDVSSSPPATITLTDDGLSADTRGVVYTPVWTARNTLSLNPSGALQTGSASLTLAAGEIGLTKIAASGSAPGAAGVKFGAVCGTNAGTAKIIAYAGTSTTPVTIVDNIGSGVTGC